MDSSLCIAVAGSGIKGTTIAIVVLRRGTGLVLSMKVVKISIYLLVGLAMLGAVLAPRDKTRSATPAPTSLGDFATVGGTSPWICASTREAYEEALTWALKNDQQELASRLARSHSTLLMPGAHVKVIDTSMLMRKVHLLDNDRFAAALDHGECWTATEALAKQ